MTVLARPYAQGQCRPGTRRDLADVFVLRVAGRTKVIAEERRLDDVNTCVEDVLAGRVPARVVFTFDPLRSGLPLA